jgi:prolipoprotein diacylglyceryltransferase
MPTNPAYGLLMIAGIAISAIVWRRVTRGSRIPLMVFVGGLIGAVLGAKLAYFAVELPLRWDAPHFWENVLLGRTLLGGLLGGYLGVEWASEFAAMPRRRATASPSRCRWVWRWAGSVVTCTAVARVAYAMLGGTRCAMRPGRGAIPPRSPKRRSI